VIAQCKSIPFAGKTLLLIEETSQDAGERVYVVDRDHLSEDALHFLMQANVIEEQDSLD